jgi:hypothetical protein
MSVTEQAVPGTAIPSGSLISPGGGQGPQGITAVSADAGNLAVLGSDNLISVPTSNVQPVIWSQRLRSYNAVGNPTFEVDQRNAGAALTNPANQTFLQDRWIIEKIGTMTADSGGINGGTVLVPGTSFQISNSFRWLKLTAQEITLGAGDYLGLKQIIEGCNFRELYGDVTSISLLVYSDVAPLKFSVALRSPDMTRSLVKLCTVPNAATWTLIQLPNLPKPTGGNFSNLAGIVGYSFDVTLACGLTYIAPAADTWQNGNFLGAPGMDNWASKPVNTSFYCAFIQHEPGALCTTPIDCPFGQNLDMGCLRYYQKSYQYVDKAGTVNGLGSIMTVTPANGTSLVPGAQFKKPMARIPAVTIYNASTGAINSIWTGTNLTVNNVTNIGDSGFGWATISSPNTAGNYCNYHYTADTGW